MSVKYRHTPGRMPCSSSQAKPGRKSVPPRPLITISSGRSSAVYSAASCNAESTWRTMTRSGWISVATSRSSAQNSARVAAGSDPEVSTMTAIASMPSERIDGK